MRDGVGVLLGSKLVEMPDCMCACLPDQGAFSLVTHLNAPALKACMNDCNTGALTTRMLCQQFSNVDTLSAACLPVCRCAVEGVVMRSTAVRRVHHRPGPTTIACCAQGHHSSSRAAPAASIARPAAAAAALAPAAAGTAPRRPIQSMVPESIGQSLASFWNMQMTRMTSSGLQPR